MTSRQYRLGNAKLGQKCLQTIPNPFQKLLQNYKSFLFSQIYWLTYSLPPSLTHYLLMLSDKHKSITAKATGLILHCSMSFHLEMYIFTNCSSSSACIMNFKYLCSPLFSIPFSTAVQVICGMRIMALVQD